MLQPRKFKYKTRQTKRIAKNPSTPKFWYGETALVILQPFQISAKRIFRLNLFLKHSARPSDTTRRSFWISVFPHLPLSRKSKGMRMGKGAGKLANWHTQIRGGKALVEFKNLRLGRAAHYSARLGSKLPTSWKFCYPDSKNVKIVGSRRTNPTLLTFW